MSVSFICPACDRPVTAQPPSIAHCPHCGSALPPGLATTVREQIAAERARVATPTLLKVAGAFLGLWGLVALPVGLLTLLGSGGTYSVNGVEVTREAFMAQAGLAFALFPVFGVLALAIAAGIAGQRRWVRPLLLGFVIVAPTAPALAMLHTEREVVGEMPWVIGFTLALGALAWWYLYRRPTVVAYYQMLALAPGDESRATGRRPAA